ncbi:MAG: hypothetical protein GY928_02095 [Colwellia sp.]|nr:hypothetical protein [Colwellia sp.]
MKYLAKVKKTRDGERLNLYVKVLFFYIWIDSDSTSDNEWLFIDEIISKWKCYYGDKLTIEDCRRFVSFEDLMNGDSFKFGSEKPEEVVYITFDTSMPVQSSSDDLILKSNE